MFTDIVGYTELAHADEGTALRLVREQEEIVTPLLALHRGRRIKSTGDGLLVEFESALHATQCAFDIQERLYERNSRAGVVPLRVRIGIHLGDVEEQGTDILGDAVNLAARIEPIADPGGVCLSAQVHDQVRNKVPYPLEKLGPRTLKGIRGPVDVFRLVLPWTASVIPTDAHPKNRIAVLPFTNISPDPNDAYIADGMTEELIATMSKISGLNVIARTSVTRYKSGERNVEEIAKEVRAGTILEGSVRKAGDKVRITVQVIDSESEVHLWAESYDREMKDIFSIESDIAQTVAEAVKVRLGATERSQVQSEPTHSPEAHALYLRGVAYNTTEYGREASLISAIKCFERAIRIDPTYASAHSWLADSYLSLYLLGALPAEKAWTEGEAAATRALELDPNDSDAHAALCALRFYQGDMARAEREVRKALELSPNNTYNHSYFAGLLANTDRIEEALSQARIAIELAPLDRFANEMLVWILKNERRYDQAIAVLRGILEFDPDHADFRTSLGECEMGLSHADRAVPEFRKADELERSDLTQSNLAWALARSGGAVEASHILDTLVQQSASRAVAYHCITQIQVALGHPEAAYAVWERALAENDSRRLRSLPHALRTGLAYDGLRTEPRFTALLTRLGAGAHPTSLSAELRTESVQMREPSERPSSGEGPDSED